MGNLKNEKYLDAFLEEHPQFKPLYDSVEFMRNAKNNGRSVNADIHYGKNSQPGYYLNGISCVWSNPGVNLHVFEGEKCPVFKLQTCVVSKDFVSNALFIRLDDIVNVESQDTSNDGWAKKCLHIDLKDNMSCDVRLRLMPEAS